MGTNSAQVDVAGIAAGVGMAKATRMKGMAAMLETLTAYADADERAMIVIYPNGGWSLHNYERMEREADERAEKRAHLAAQVQS